VVAAGLAAPRDPLTAEEIKGRAAGGAVTLGARSLVIFGLGVVGNLVLARLLVPRDLGLVALGTTLITVARYISDAGVAVALIGRTETPSREELGAVQGFQLATTTALAVCFAAAASPFGRDGLVPALMITSLPLASLRMPTVLMLERQLNYGVIARADVVEAVVGYTWAIATVAVGWGVWGLASAAPIRVLAGSATVMRLGPVGLVRPRWDWHLVRPILGFGVRFQAINAVSAGRDQGLNAGIAAIAGVPTLGLWSLAWRIMQVPFLLFVTLWRVSYPAMSRLLETRHDPRPVIERAIGVVAVALSPIVVGIAAGAHALLPPLVGNRWAPSADILVFSSAAMMISAPVSITSVGYLLASRQPTKILISAVAQAVTWLGVALSLLSPLGVTAIGLGWLAMSLVDLTLLSRWVGRDTGARIMRSLMGPAAVAVLAGGLGLIVASAGHHRVLTGLLGVFAAELLLLGGLRALAPEQLRAAARISWNALSAARAG